MEPFVVQRSTLPLRGKEPNFQEQLQNFKPQKYRPKVFSKISMYSWQFSGGLCALGGIFILTLPIPIVVNSFASYYKNRLWRNEVAYKKRQRAKKRREMELLMRDNLLNILTVPGK